LSRAPSSEPEPTELRPSYRRASRRTALQAEIEVLEPVTGRGVALNGSALGIRIAVDCPLAEGLRCTILTRFGPGLERIEAARVVWVLELRDGWVAGLELCERC
jgi:hypothetical protein